MTTAERLVSMPWWEWREGMMVIEPPYEPHHIGDVSFRVTRIAPTRHAYPDLDDPATQGVLLAWCRELEPTTNVHPLVRRTHDEHMDVAVITVAEWRLSSRGVWRSEAASSNYGEAIALGLIALQEER